MRPIEQGLLEVIPVIDLRGGFVVAAQGGLPRDRYPLLHSALCPDASPHTLLRRLSSSTAVRTVYIADLDALSQRPPQQDLIAELASAHPQLCFWLDAGYSDSSSLAGLPPVQNLVPVIGSETWRGIALDPELLMKCVPSFDYRGSTAEGIGRMTLPKNPPPGLQAILMCLDRMGRQNGPDLARLREASTRHSGVRWILAGGIRDQSDLQAAQASGASGVLAASAIHRGDIRLI